MQTRLNIGCSQHILPQSDGWVNIDCRTMPGVDMVCDINNRPWPWADGAVDEIFAAHVLEHLDAPLAAIMEMRRILRPGGKMTIIVPNATGLFAHSIGHFSYFSAQWFGNLSGSSDLQNDVGKLFATTRITLHVFHHRYQMPLLPRLAIRIWEKFWNINYQTQMIWEILGVIHPSEVKWVATK